jgi:hypothetical protein
VIVLASVIIGLLGGILASAGGASLVESFMTGAVALGGAATLILAFVVAFKIV